MRKYRIKIKAMIVLVSILTMLFSFSAVPYAVEMNQGPFHGPYLIEMTENAVTVMWTTDFDAAAKVEYGTEGSFTNSAIDTDNGLIAVGTIHKVRLTGLTPGTSYNYRLVTTPVSGLNESEPVLGEPIISPGYTFTTMDANKEEFTFWFMPDLHATCTFADDLLKLVDYDDCDFVVFGGDIFCGNGVNGKQHYWNILDPAVNRFAKSIPSVFVNGNHEMRGKKARELYEMIPLSAGTRYYSFNHGPASIGIIDSLDNAIDDHPANAGLIKTGEYRSEQLNWFSNYFASDDWRNSTAKILISHIPNFSELGDRAEWVRMANEAGTQLVVSGHNHYYEHYFPGQNRDNADYHLLTLGYNQVAKINVSSEEIGFVVYNIDGTVHDRYSFKIPYNPDDYVNHTQNLALGKSARASSEYSATYSASKAIDGVIGVNSTWYSLTEGDQWLEVDLGEPMLINRTVAREHTADYLGLRIKTFKIQYQDPASGNWVDVYSGYRIGSFRQITFEPVIAQKVRIYIDYTVDKYTLTEFEVYYVEDAEPTPPEEPVENIVIEPEPAEPGRVSLLEKGSTWKYLDDGSNPGAAWKNPSFDDSGWKSGPAQLGYNEGDENTVVSYGPDYYNKYPTTYFRTTFNVDDPSKWDNLYAHVLFDDGVVVYLNGVEILRCNMDVPTPTYNSYAEVQWDFTDETRFFKFAINNAGLVAGTNVIAAEVHQVSRTSSDLSFDLELTGIRMTTPEETVIYMIDALPDIADVSFNDTDAINAAKEAYDALTEGQKELVPAEKVDKLNGLIAKLEELSGLKPFVIGPDPDGLTTGGTTGGIIACVNISDNPDYLSHFGSYTGDAVVVFQLMDGNKPVSIVAAKYNGAGEYYGFFNVAAGEYTVKVFVVDAFNADTTAPVSLADSKSMQK